MNPSKIRRILLCLAGLLLTSLTGFSQGSTPTATGMPVPRTLTSADGRKLEVTLLEKTATAIKAKRASDGVEFTLELAKLSADDQAFIAGLAVPVAAPEIAPTPASPAGSPTTGTASGKVRVLHLAHPKYNTRPALEAGGFEIVPISMDKLEKFGKTGDLSILQNIDVLWLELSPMNSAETAATLMFNEMNKLNKILVIKGKYKNIKKADLLLGKEPERPNQTTFLKVDGNFIIFNPDKWGVNDKEPTIDLKLTEEVVKNFTELVKARQAGLIKPGNK